MSGNGTVEEMNYRVKDLLSEPLTDDDIKDARQIIGRGELMVYPTETFYALGCDPFNEDAVGKLVNVKNRPGNMPISIAVSDMNMMGEVAIVNTAARRLYKAFLPGPLTILLEKKVNIPSYLTGAGDRIGIRVPDHPAALKLIESLGPLTATSANMHDRAAPWDIEPAINQLGDAVALYMNGGILKYQAPSTVVDITDEPAKIIRKGVILEDEINSAII